MGGGSRLEALSRGDCEVLLAQAALGRVAVVVDGRPQIFPVNHVFDPELGAVAFPTDAGTKLAAILTMPWVAFEADGIDAVLGPWSVLVTGIAEEVTDRSDVDRLSPLRSVLWRSGPDAHWVRIVPKSLTGRRIASPETRMGPGERI